MRCLCVFSHVPKEFSLNRGFGVEKPIKCAWCRCEGCYRMPSRRVYDALRNLPQRNKRFAPSHPPPAVSQEPNILENPNPVQITNVDSYRTQALTYDEESRNGEVRGSDSNIISTSGVRTGHSGEDNQNEQISRKRPGSHLNATDDVLISNRDEGIVQNRDTGTEKSMDSDDVPLIFPAFSSKKTRYVEDQNDDKGF